MHQWRENAHLRGPSARDADLRGLMVGPLVRLSDLRGVLLLDFSDMRKFEPGKHAVLIVRLADSEEWRVGDHLVGWFSDPDARTWERCMVIASPRKVRVVRAGSTER